MESKRLEKRILAELDRLIVESCSRKTISARYREFHNALLKNHYNAADVDIDYHRKRIKMNVITDDSSYDPKKVNQNLPILHVNLMFKNLREFLKTCLQSDRRSLSFYAQLLQRFRRRELTPAL